MPLSVLGGLTVSVTVGWGVLGQGQLPAVVLPWPRGVKPLQLAKRTVVANLLPGRFRGRVPTNLTNITQFWK